MEFIVKKDEFLNGIRIVEHATAMKGLQPVLANILIETIDESTLKFSATDLDLTIITEIQAQVKEEGQITLPAKKLLDIVSRLSDELVEFKIDLDSNSANIKCKNSKFSLIGISSQEFPPVAQVEMSEENAIDIDVKTLNNAVKQVGFAAAGYESNNLLSGIVFNISETTLEMASTDGNRLARIREEVKKQNQENQLIIPARTLNEFTKVAAFVQEDSAKLFINRTKLVIKMGSTVIISTLMDGQYPKYNQLIPQSSPKEAVVKVSSLIAALERVAIMVNEKTNIVKFDFVDNKLILSGNTPEAGTSEDAIDIEYESEELTIAFNYRYVLEAVKNIESEEIKIGLNTPLSATVIKPNDDVDYISLVMPVQIKG